jgi:hypothetical protein
MIGHTRCRPPVRKRAIADLRRSPRGGLLKSRSCPSITDSVYNGPKRLSRKRGAGWRCSRLRRMIGRPQKPTAARHLTVSQMEEQYDRTGSPNEFPCGDVEIVVVSIRIRRQRPTRRSLGANPVGYLVLTEERLITLMTAREKGDGCSSWRVTRQHDRIFRSLQAAR